jgi:hypothetical protein
MAKNPLECPTRAVEWCGHTAYAAHPLASVRHRSWLVTGHHAYLVQAHHGDHVTNSHHVSPVQASHGNHVLNTDIKFLLCRLIMGMIFCADIIFLMYMFTMEIMQKLADITFLFMQHYHGYHAVHSHHVLPVEAHPKFMKLTSSCSSCICSSWAHVVHSHHVPLMQDYHGYHAVDGHHVLLWRVILGTMQCTAIMFLLCRLIMGTMRCTASTRPTRTWRWSPTGRATSPTRPPLPRQLFNTGYSNKNPYSLNNSSQFSFRI